ncbi:enoyl-CoA hydratase/isomerase family protein [Silicimonas sp. MF1-12-2]|jgi:enoyl-CoA hydratase/carnithine racemase|uniref:enoyl-CoA hydratase/isomerase family protein n=1 Tax=Silicimonas sp. MF1-12-2 TaxID=3384793 RepID=UPI0039B4CA62
MIDVEDEGALRIITLDRPDKANALTREMLAALADTVERAAADPAVKVVVLTGRGKVFSAGADLDEARAGLATDGVWERLSGAIADSPILTIAALNGTAAGGALGMVLACDLRIAVPGAKIFYPVMKLGFLPQPSDPGRLAALVGPARAKLILMGGARIEAPEALAIGLVDRLAEDPVAEARALAADAMGADRSHVEAIKEMLS